MSENIYTAKACTVVGDLAICRNCDTGLGWNKQFGIWYHFDTGSQQCPIRGGSK